MTLFVGFLSLQEQKIVGLKLKYTTNLKILKDAIHTGISLWPRAGNFISLLIIALL
jgi:hypothetical protein